MPRRASRRRPMRLAVLSTLLIFISLWLIWLAVAHVRLNSALSRARATGNPLDGTRLPWSPPPTTLPTANFLHQAIAAISPFPVPANATIPNVLPDPRRVQTPPTATAPDPLAQSWLRNNARALALARQARDTDEIGWTPADSVGPLADLLSIGSAQAHSSGNDREAIELALDQLHLAYGLEREHPQVVFDRGVNFETVACTDLQTAIAAPATSTANSPFSNGSVERRHLEALIPAC